MPSAPALPRVSIDGVAGTPDSAPQRPSRVSSLPPGAPGPKRAAAPAIPRVALPSAVAPTLPGDERVADLPSRAEPSAPKQGSTAARPTPSDPSRSRRSERVCDAYAKRAAFRHARARGRRADAVRGTAPELTEVPRRRLGVSGPPYRPARGHAKLRSSRRRKNGSSSAAELPSAETKNLNSFRCGSSVLGRAAVDCCDELTHALNAFALWSEEG
jgi:hypothetical protein